jgi:hypothetical protein
MNPIEQNPIMRSSKCHHYKQTTRSYLPISLALTHMSFGGGWNSINIVTSKPVMKKTVLRADFRSQAMVKRIGVQPFVNNIKT